MSGFPVQPGSAARRGALLLTLLAALLGASAPGAAGTVFPGAPVEPPSTAIQSLGATAISYDGTGGVAYLRQDAGIAHVYVSRFFNGVAHPPERVDTGQLTPSSAPVLGAGNGGRLAVAWVNGGALFAAVVPGQGESPAAPRPLGPLQPWSSPQPVAPVAVTPSLSMSVHGAAVLVWTVPAATAPGSPAAPAQVRAARVGLTGTTFGTFAGALNFDPTRNAGATPATAPVVKASNDGTAVAAWGEDGADGRTHVIERRVLRDHLGTAPQDATLATLSGHPGGSADSPAVGVEDNSGFAFVAFRQAFDTATATHALVRPLTGSLFNDAFKLDALGFPASDAAGPPSIDVSGPGLGVAVTGLTLSHQIMFATLLNNDWADAARADSTANAIVPTPLAAIGYLGAGLVAWTQSTGPADPTSVHGRPLFKDGTLGAEALLSNPSLGAVDPTLGLSAQADALGDTLVGFVQSGPAGRAVSLALLDPGPAKFRIESTSRWRTLRRPRMSWTSSTVTLGSVSYRVVLDGRTLGTTTRTVFVAPHALPDGEHDLVVVASDARGATYATSDSAVRVDTRPPRVAVSGGGSHVTVRVTDPPAPSATGRRIGSGVDRVQIDWGDGSSTRYHATASHHYSGGGHTVRVTATDHAGNVTRYQRRV